MSDIEFSDLNNDGLLELVVASSLKGMKKRKGWYVGFKVQSISTNKRQFEVPNLIHHSPIFWVPWISGCDLNEDGDIDLVTNSSLLTHFFMEPKLVMFFRSIKLLL